MPMTEEQKRAYRKAYQERKREDERIRALPSPIMLPNAADLAPKGVLPRTNLVPAEMQMVEPTQAVFQKELELADQAEQNRMNARTRKLSSLDNAFGAEEQSLDLPFQKQETVDPFMKPLKKLSADDLPTAEEYNEPKKNNVSMDKVDKWLDPNYQLSKEEKKEAQETAESFFSRYGLEHAPMKDIYKYAAEHPEFNEEYEKMKKLTLKATTLGNFGSGFKSAFTDVASGLADMAIGKTKDNADKYAGLVSSMTGVPEEEVRNTIGNAYGQIAEKKQDIFNPIETEKENAKTQNSLAYGAGNLGGKALQYIATEPLFAGAAASAGLGKGGAFVANQIGQNAQDLALDTLPSYYEMQRQGLSDDEIGKELAKNIGINAGMNLGLGALGEIPGLIKNAKNTKQLPQLDEAAKMQEYYNSQANPTIERQLLDELNASDRRIAEEAAALEQPKIPQDMLEQARAEQAMQRRLAEEAEAVRESRLTSDMLKETPVETPKVETPAEAPVETPRAEALVEAPRALERPLDLDDMRVLQQYGAEFENRLKGANASPEFKKAYNDFWEYIVNSGNGTNTLDRAAVEEALRRTAPEGSDVDGFLRSVGEQIDSDGLKFATDVEHTMKELTEAEQKAIEGRTFRELTQEELERVKDGFTYNKRFVRDMEMAARGNDDLMKAVEEVKAAHNAYYDAALNGDKNLIERLSKDFNNAVGRASRKFEKEGIKGFSTSRKLASTFDDPKRVIMGAQTRSKEELARNLDILNDVDESNRYARPANEKSVALRANNGDSTYMGTKKFSEIVGSNALQSAEKDVPNIKVVEKAPSAKTVEVEPRAKKELSAFGEEMRERGYHKSSREHGAIPDEVKEALSEKESMDRNMYKVAHNADAQAKAENLWSNVKTWDEAEETFNQLLKDRDTATAAFARKLVSAYSENGQTESAMRIMDAISEAGTKAGQFSQSLILGLVKDDPQTALRYAERALDKINREGQLKFGKKWQNFVLSKEERKMFADIKPGDEEAIKNAYNAIGERISRDHPVKMMEKLKEATHIGMLFNTRTMSRNFFANPPTLAMRAAANRTEAVLQRVGHAFNKEIEVTQSLLGGGLKERKLAKDIFKRSDVQDLYNALNGKYDETGINAFVKSKQMFKGNTPIDKLVDGLLGGFFKENGGLITKANAALGAKGNNSLLELVRNTIYKLLELGDVPFVKENFVARLASELKAKKITDASQVTSDMIQRAFVESLEATYKDPNRLSKLLLDIKKHTGLLGEVAIPFSQTLGSIGMRSIENSPAGFLKSLANLRKGAMTGKKEFVEQGIKDLSKALTGTGMILAGMGLYKSGLITGDYDEDKNVQAAQKRAGFLPYAISLGNKFFTYDWAQPASIPLIMGTAIAQALEDDSDKEGLAKVWEGVKNGTLAGVDSWFNQSAFQTLAELLGGGSKKSYGENSIAENFAKAIIESPQRLIGTQIGAMARTADRSYRDTYDPTSYGKTLLNQVASKLPGVSENLPQSYDLWGQPRMRADSVGEALLQQNVIPGSYDTYSPNEYDKKLQEIYDRYPEGKLFPDTVGYKASVGEFTKELNNKEHSELTKIQGGYNAELADAMFKEKDFEGLSDADKVEVANKAWNVARDLAYQEMFDKEPTSTNQKYVDIYKQGGAKGVMEQISKEYAVKQSGLDADEKNIELYEKGGAEALNEKASMSEALKGTGVSLNDNNMSYIREHPDSLDYIPKLAEQGITSQNAWRSYEVAKTKGYTPETFADTYKSIETNGKSGLTQGEIAAYLNLIKATAEQAQEIDEIYRRSDWDVNKKPKNDGSGWKYAK